MNYKPRRPDPTPAPPLPGFKVELTSRTHAMGMAAQLRLIAQLLESGEMVSTMGGIKVNSNFSGEVTIESNLVLSTKTQPKVEPATEEVHEQVCTEVDVHRSLEKMGDREVSLLSFDHGEEDLCHDWAAIVRNRGRYPLLLEGRTFDVKLSRSATDICLRIERLT